ncbi:MAG: Tll0287-like domain-containing protein [Nitrospiraceae bacterium]
MNSLVALFVLLGFLGSPVWAQANPDAVETGRLLAVLLDAGRITIGNNQTLINDPDRGDKSFTPGAFEEQLVNVFKMRTGVDLADLEHSRIPAMAKPLLAKLLEECKKTVDSYQTVINLKGMKYKGLIPATFGTETATRFSKWSGIYLKQTAPERLLRNPQNKADAYEAAAMQQFAAPSFSRDKDVVLDQVVEGGKSVRIMLPLYYQKACLSCHGEPKGERDISGFPKEGGVEGELGGAISVKLALP